MVRLLSIGLYMDPKDVAQMMMPSMNTFPMSDAIVTDDSAIMNPPGKGIRCSCKKFFIKPVFIGRFFLFYVIF
jgi:hypothetical protein